MNTDCFGVNLYGDALRTIVKRGYCQDLEVRSDVPTVAPALEHGRSVPIAEGRPSLVVLPFQSILYDPEMDDPRSSHRATRPWRNLQRLELAAGGRTRGTRGRLPLTSERTSRPPNLRLRNNAELTQTLWAGLICRYLTLGVVMKAGFVAACFAAAVALSPAAASAALLTYTETADVSGSLDGVAFTDNVLTLK